MFLDSTIHNFPKFLYSDGSADAALTVSEFPIPSESSCQGSWSGSVTSLTCHRKLGSGTDFPIQIIEKGTVYYYDVLTDVTLNCM